jgi:hypothetical protein
LVVRSRAAERLDSNRCIFAALGLTALGLAPWSSPAARAEEPPAGKAGTPRFHIIRHLAQSSYNFTREPNLLCGPTFHLNHGDAWRTAQWNIDL